MMQKRITGILSVILSVFVLCVSIQADKNDYDIIIVNGRVMDPLTRADFIGHVGIKDGKIGEIVPIDPNQKEQKKLKGDMIVDATGLVVAPGFIDMHTHEGILSLTMECFIKDGRTTMIGGNCGGAHFHWNVSFEVLSARGP